MPDDPTPIPTPPPLREQVWFLARLRGFGHALLYDEAAAQRMVGVALLALGQLIASGGVIPGTQTVVPLPHWMAQYGDLVKLASIYLVAGGRFPAAPPPKAP